VTCKENLLILNVLKSSSFVFQGPSMRLSSSFSDVLEKLGATVRRPSSPRWLQIQLALQLAGVVESFGLVQSGPKPSFSGTLIMANGPALCSPLNGVGLVGSK
jgi:hypothetical protein